MAARAVRRKLGCGVIGVCRGIVVRRVAAKTSIRRGVVISVVAGGAIVGNDRVRAIQNIIVVVNSKSRWRPIWCGRVTTCAIGREIQGYVVRVRTLVVVRCMAPRASIWRVRIIAVVAGDTVIRDRHVRSGEGIDRLVIKRRRRPGRFSMASRTVGRELVGCVVGVCGLVKIRCVAPGAGVWRVGVIAVVTGRAVVGYSYMSTI